MLAQLAIGMVIAVTLEALAMAISDIPLDKIARIIAVALLARLFLDWQNSRSRVVCEIKFRKTIRHLPIRKDGDRD